MTDFAPPQVVSAHLQHAEADIQHAHRLCSDYRVRACIDRAQTALAEAQTLLQAATHQVQRG